jgi:DNA-binding NarL/FixJ family response regulator
VSDALHRLIDGRSDLAVAGHSADHRQVVQLQAKCQPDAILVDASLEGLDALTLLGDLLAADRDGRIAVLLARPDPDFIHRLLRRGALACVLKSDPPEELVRALQSAVAGSVYLSRRVAAVAVRQLAGSKEGGRREGPAGLTDRELEVFHLVGAAKANREIATLLGMSVKTVETHKENIKVKLGAASAAELADRAREWLQHS